jgi:hypothetical protein
LFLALAGQRESILILAACIVAGGMIYAGMMYLTQRSLVVEVRDLLLRSRAKRTV